jgi:hypothetical protein
MRVTEISFLLSEAKKGSISTFTNFVYKYFHSGISISASTFQDQYSLYYEYIICPSLLDLIVEHGFICTKFVVT